MLQLVIVQRKQEHVLVLGIGAHSKSKRHFPPAFQAAQSIVPSIRLGRWLRTGRVIVLKVMLHTFDHHRLLFGNWNVVTLIVKELELVEEAKKYLDIVRFSTKRCDILQS